MSTTLDLSGVDILTLLGWTGKRPAARTNGGEYQGSCIWCGGKDRMSAFPAPAEAGKHPYVACRQCCQGGDAITIVQHLEGLDFLAACERLRVAPAERQARPMEPTPPPHDEPPNADWQMMALRFWQYSMDQLWSDPGAPGRAYVQQRGLDLDFMQLTCVGYNPDTIRANPAKWGLDLRDDNGNPKKLWLPRGLVFVCWPSAEAIGVEPWRLIIRRLPDDCAQFAPELRYLTISGSTGTTPFGMEWIAPSRPLALVEGPIDALVVQQAMEGDIGHPCLGSAVAVGTTGGQKLQYQIPIASASPILIALDDEPDNAGVQRAAQTWLDVCKPYGLRWAPTAKDPGAMAERGDDLRKWIEEGLSMARALPFADVAAVPGH